MIILQINIEGIASSEPKGYSPVARQPNTPRSLPVTFQLVQIEPWQAQIEEMNRRV
jgi:hypothetical protein